MRIVKQSAVLLLEFTPLFHQMTLDSHNYTTFKCVCKPLRLFSQQLGQIHSVPNLSGLRTRRQPFNKPLSDGNMDLRSSRVNENRSVFLHLIHCTGVSFGKKQ
jgi:hypothetical protein